MKSAEKEALLAALIGSVLFWFLLATVLAGIEVESEGKYGWAEKMPTWYRTTGFWGRLYGYFMSGKPLTGYHLLLSVFVLSLFHIPLFSGVAWGIAWEFETLAIFFLWVPSWDYNWFVLNPHFKGRFKKKYVWWHAGDRWVFGLFPLSYLIGVALSMGCAGGAALAAGSQAPFLKHLAFLGGFGICTVLLHLAAPAYRHWYLRMRQSDDRDKAPIFHRDAA